jgi:hypothetical protein
MAEIRRFVGTCDVCGQELTLEWDFAAGIIDWWIEDDGSRGTWIRHPEGADPRCDSIFSHVTEVV